MIWLSLLWGGVKAFAGRAIVFLRSLPWQAWAVAAVIAMGVFYGHLRYNAGQADVQAKFDAYQAKMVAATQKAKEAALRAEHAQAGAIAAAVDQLTKENADALAKRNAVAAGVRAGTVRLQDRWSCPTRVPTAAAGAVQFDADAALRAAGAGDLVQVGAEADAALKACQAVLKADRETAP
jgi:hypothetical protein